MSIADQQSLYRQIPAVDQLLLRDAVREWVSRTSREFVVQEIQLLLQRIRDSIRSGGVLPEETNPERIEAALILNLGERLRPRLRTVINGTGVVLHTNLGRAPLGRAAQESLSAFSAGYTNLEYDIDAGQRSQRDKLLGTLLQELLGCEAATVVNNNAAAVFLILNSLAAGREVIVSRGELVEIGGSFRIPDIMTRSGAVLREVGTTNKTRMADYQEAIGPATALLLRVHPSNFRMSGFTDRPELNDLVELSRASGIPLVEDIGSGCLVDLKAYGVADEPVVQESLAAGVDLVCFSGDKLLGGPQAGIIVGRGDLVTPIRKNPLMRTYRVDKLVYGALEATLRSYRFGVPQQEIPILRMISATGQELEARTRSFSRRLNKRLPEGARVQLISGHSVIGGGSCPESRLPTTLLALESNRRSPNQIESKLRSLDPPIVVRLEEDKVLVDLRTISPSEEPILIEGLRRALE